MIKLSLQQLSDIRHALGGITMYRNHFNTITENESWNELVEIGYAVKRNMGREMGGITYFVTEKAIQNLKNILF